MSATCHLISISNLYSLASFYLFILFVILMLSPSVVMYVCLKMCNFTHLYIYLVYICTYMNILDVLSSSNLLSIFSSVLCTNI